MSMKDSQEKQIKFIDPIDKLTTCAAFNKICILNIWLWHTYKKTKRRNLEYIANLKKFKPMNVKLNMEKVQWI